MFRIARLSVRRIIPRMSPKVRQGMPSMMPSNTLVTATVSKKTLSRRNPVALNGHTGHKAHHGLTHCSRAPLHESMPRWLLLQLVHAGAQLKAAAVVMVRRLHLPNNGSFHSLAQNRSANSANTSSASSSLIRVLLSSEYFPCSIFDM